MMLRFELLKWLFLKRNRMSAEGFRFDVLCRPVNI